MLKGVGFELQTFNNLVLRALSKLSLICDLELIDYCVNMEQGFVGF